MRRGGLLGVVLIVLFLFVMLALIATALVMHGLEWRGELLSESKKVGTPHTLGEFNVTALEVEDVVGRVVVFHSNGSSLVVETNLPIEYSVNSSLTLYCPSENWHNLCSDYRDGYVVVKAPYLEYLHADDLVGNLVLNVGVNSLTARDVVGNVIVRNVSIMSVEDVTGNVKGVCGRASISNVVGNVDLALEDGGSINNVVGNVRIYIPENASVTLKSGGLFEGRLRIEGDVYDGSYKVPVEVSDVTGNVFIGKGASLITSED